MIDLHLHTTASDGRCTPAELVARAAAAGVTTLAVTDHDTIAGHAEAARAAQAHGVEFVPGIEITAVENGRDVHMLGYFLAPDEPGLVAFLDSQRGIRRERLFDLGRRLAELGMPLDVPALVADAERDAGRSMGRPLIADAMIAAGYVDTRREAFDRWLAVGALAFVPRAGASPEEVIDIVHRAGGLISLAHPGRTGLPDARIAALCAAGLDAIEAYHSDHDDPTIRGYVQLARTLGVLMTGGSDYHGDPAHGVMPGGTTLPHAEWQRLSAARATGA